VDHIFQVKSNPRAGKSRQAHLYQRRPGGKGFNQAVALARLGADTTLLTSLGHDADAREIAGVLAEEGVRLANIETNDAGWRPTPQTAVIQPNTGAPTYIGYLGSDEEYSEAAI
jgi:ribokinase